MDGDILLFFDKMPGALPLYEELERRIKTELGEVRIKVQKTQISFYNRRMFACVSFAKLRNAETRPKEYIVVTFGLGRREISPRIDAASEPYPNRWTHHVLASEMSEIDDELMLPHFLPENGKIKQTAKNLFLHRGRIRETKRFP